MAEQKLDHKVVLPLKHNKKKYAPKETVKLTADEAALLIEQGVVEAPEGTKEEEPEKPKK